MLHLFEFSQFNCVKQF